MQREREREKNKHRHTAGRHSSQSGGGAAAAEEGMGQGGRREEGLLHIDCRLQCGKIKNSKRIRETTMTEQTMEKTRRQQRQLKTTATCHGGRMLSRSRKGSRGVGLAREAAAAGRAWRSWKRA